MHRRVEDALRDTLRARAADVPHEPDPWERTQRAVAGDRRRRRRLGAAVVVGLLAVAALIGLVLQTAPRPSAIWHQRRQPAAGPDPSTWPVRGNLARDRLWTRGALAWARRSSPHLGSSRLVFAGDVPGGRLAVVVGSDGNEAGTALHASAWYGAGRPGPGLLHEDGSSDVVSSPIVWARAQPGGRLAVVALGPTALSAGAVSGAPSYSADGTATRTFTSVAEHNGVAITSIPGHGPQLARFRATFSRIGFDGSTRHVDTYAPATLVAATPRPTGLSQLAAGVLDAYPAPVGDPDGQLVTDVLAGFLARYGDRAPDLDARLAFAGQLSPRVSAVALLIRRGDGSAFQVVRTRRELPDAGGGTLRETPVDGVPVPAEQADRWPFHWQEAIHEGILNEHVIAPSAVRAELVYPPDTRLDTAVLDGRGYGALNRTQAAPMNLSGSLQLRLPQSDGSPTLVVPLRRPVDEDPLADGTVSLAGGARP